MAWHVSADQEEPWRRFLQELSDTPREEVYEVEERSYIATFGEIPFSVIG